MIKKLLFIVPLFVAGTLAAQNPIPNGNFEHWDSVIIQNPDGYQDANNGRGNLPSNAPPNVTQTTGYHGKYGVQLSTIVFDGDTGFAYITNSINNPVTGQGGIPYSQQATGVRLYYKCNVMPKDSAGVMFVFKNSGKIIGTYYYTFLGTTASYTLFSKTFAPALSMAPDTVIFAATSSNIIFGGNGKAGSTLTIDSVTFTGVASQPALMNGDFENWTPDSVYNPHSWFVLSVGDARSNDRKSGKYSLQLENGIPPGNSSINEGFATDGIEYAVNSNHDSVIGGYPYSQASDSIIFWYKYLPGGTGHDTGALFLQFNKNSTYIFGAFMELPPSPTWKRMSGYFNIGSNPDSVLTYIYSANGNPQLGSILRIDSIQFYSQIIAGIPSIANNEGSINVYPNPTGSLVFVDLSNYSGKVDAINIYDISGQLIESRNYNFNPLHNTTTTFDLSGYSAGTYLISIKTPSGVRVEKVSKVQ